jgi:hypothetical protein
MAVLALPRPLVTGQMRAEVPLTVLSFDQALSTIFI